MENRKMRPGEKWTDYIDAEDLARNEAAIRTALMLGAEFKQDKLSNWYVEGIDCKSINKTMPAWLFLATHGIGITHDARPALFKDIHNEILEAMHNDGTKGL